MPYRAGHVRMTSTCEHVFYTLHQNLSCRKRTKPPTPSSLLPQRHYGTITSRRAYRELPGPAHYCFISINIDTIYTFPVRELDVITACECVIPFSCHRMLNRFLSDHFLHDITPSHLNKNKNIMQIEVMKCRGARTTPC
jgi:hypothetical protein